MVPLKVDYYYGLSNNYYCCFVDSLMISRYSYINKGGISYISLPSASPAKRSGNIHHSFCVQPYRTLLDHKPKKTQYSVFQAKTRYIETCPVPSVGAEIIEASLSVKDKTKESWKATTLSDKCDVATLKREPKEIPASAVISKQKATNMRDSAIPFIVAPLRNKLDQYQILMYPLVTESATKNMIENNTLVFLVDVRSDKASIKNAFEMICNIKTVKVNTLRTYHGTKKAFIKLGPAYDATDVAKKFKFI